MDILFSANNIVKRYGNHTALDNVSIDVPEGSIFGLLGPNGAGKTSLIRIINQITGPDQGTLHFKGKLLTPDDISRIGYLPEERGLYKKMAVAEQVLYLAQLKGLSKRDALSKLKYWFSKFEIEPWWNKKIEELSKGMQQKVQFIVTVLHEPELIILDEPFSGFDPINANLIKQEVLELRKKGATIILSTHNMGSVEELCDHIALINQAKKILDGQVKEIRHNYRSNAYEIEFKGNKLSFTNALWTGYELVECKGENDHMKAKIRLLGKNTLNNLLEVLIPVVEILSVREMIPNMNDIFIMNVKAQGLEVPETISSKSDLTE